MKIKIISGLGLITLVFFCLISIKFAKANVPPEDRLCIMKTAYQVYCTATGVECATAGECIE